LVRGATPDISSHEDSVLHSVTDFIVVGFTMYLYWQETLFKE